jgi:hypothetical protein
MYVFTPTKEIKISQKIKEDIQTGEFSPSI